eukprot:scaffold125666_cov31-Attheya_sp.AAC.1
MINIACDHGASESALCEPPYDPQLSHTPRISDNAEIYAFESTLENDVDTLSNQDSESPAMNDVFSELQGEEELEYEEVAQNSTTHGQAAIPLFVLNNKKKRNYPSWDKSLKELVEFKAINGHTKVPQRFGPLGKW